MPPLTLEGQNLGERHKWYNTKVNEVLKSNKSLESVISEYGDTDLDQLFKIDVASNYRNVDYIIKILKSEDMLHVSRAIKKSTWLITDSQYAHIINPQYLHSELFPEMTSKAVCKLLLHIRLNLKDEKRAEEFFKYDEKEYIAKAIKWLPHCSKSFIEEVFPKYQDHVNESLFKKLCEKCPSMLKLLSVDRDNYRHKASYFKAAIFLLNNDTERYLDAIEKCNHYSWPKFNKKHTAIIMKKQPQRILNKFKQYATTVDVSAVAKNLQPDKVKEFLVDLLQNKEFGWWCTYHSIRPFICAMPKEGKFEFLKELFIDNNDKGDSIKTHIKSSTNIYEWYEHAQFETTFRDLKKLIKTESEPDERLNMLKVMLTTACTDKRHVHDVLQYFHNKHINEQNRIKVAFIQTVISKTNTHEYDENSWKIFNEILHSADVYSEATNSNTTSLYYAVIVYYLLHNQPIPETIEKKFEFGTMKSFTQKLKPEQKAIVFEYLYNYAETKLKLRNDQNEVKNSVYVLETLLELLSDWDKDLINYPAVLVKIKELVLLKQDKYVQEKLVKFYKKKKSWKKYMFEESIQIYHTEAVLVNALKHESTLFERHLNEIEKVISNDKLNLLRFLSKIKIYWPKTLAEEWLNGYKKRSDQLEGYKALTIGLCMLMPYKKLIELIDGYAPTEPKVVWSNIDELLFTKRKNFAQFMHLSRPQPPPATIIRYAQGDYLKYAIFSLLAIFYNLSSKKIREYLPQILKGPVSVQKHGIRMAFAKLSATELQEIFSDIWKTTKNASIRSVIIQLTFKLLCKKGQTKVNDIWNMLEMFIDNLSHEEDPAIYAIFEKYEMVPMSVRAKFCVKGYKFLKTLPGTSYQRMIENLASVTSKLMDTIDIEFVEGILSEFINTWFVKKLIFKRETGYPNTIMSVISAYILSTADETEQRRRYEKIIQPWLKAMFEIWDEASCDTNKGPTKPISTYFDQTLNNLIYEVRDNFVKKKYVVPLGIFEDMAEEFESRVPFEENYHLITTLKIFLVYIDGYNRIKSEYINTDIIADDNEADGPVRPKKSMNKMNVTLFNKISPFFAKGIVKLLKEDMEKYFPSIEIVFSTVFNSVYSCVTNHALFGGFVLAEELMKDESCVPSHLLALSILPQRVADEDAPKLNKLQILFEKHHSKEVRMHYYRKFGGIPIVPLS